MIQCFNEISADFCKNEKPLTKELLYEWLDIIETEFFMGTLFELINESIISLVDKIES